MITPLPLPTAGRPKGGKLWDNGMFKLKGKLFEL